MFSAVALSIYADIPSTPFAPLIFHLHHFTYYSAPMPVVVTADRRLPLEDWCRECKCTEYKPT